MVYYPREEEARHQALAYEKYINFIPFFLRKLIRNVLDRFPRSSSFFRRLKKLTNNLSDDSEIITFQIRTIAKERMIKKINIRNKLIINLINILSALILVNLQNA